MLSFVFLPLTQLQAQEPFSRVTNLTSLYHPNTGKLRVDWDDVGGAQKYRVRLYRNDHVIKEKVVDLSTVTFSDTLFKTEKEYTIKVRVKKTASKRASLWRSTTYTHYPAPTVSAGEVNTVDGIATWVHLVDDGEEQLALSAETGGQIKVARFNLSHPSATPSWTTLFDSSDTGGNAIADHWHIFAHGYHWFVFSVDSADASFLAKVDSDFTVLETVNVVEVGTPGIPTNDMLLFAEPDGVTVGHFYPTYGTHLYRFNTDLELVDTLDIGSGDAAHGNGSFIIPVDDGFDLLATTTLNPAAYSGVSLVHYNFDWEVESVTELVTEDEKNTNMPMGGYLPGGYLVFSARQIEGTAAEGEDPPVRLGDDSGNVVQYVFGPDLRQVEKRTVASGGYNRTHLLIRNKKLISSWDASNAGYVQIDQYSFAE